MIKEVLRRFVVPPIGSYSIEPTNDCNMDCGFCHRKMREVGYMGFKEFRWLINQIPRNMPVTLSYGGESIVHPRFREMAEYALSHGHRVTVYSNGLENYPSGVEVIVYAKPPPIVLTWNQGFDHDYGLNPINRFCAEPYFGVNILWNGDVVPCCHCVSGNRVMGNVFKSSIKDVWMNRAFRELRLLGHCEGCEVYRYDLSAEGVENYARKSLPAYQVRVNQS